MKYYVVADVHGFYSELMEALTEKGFFEDEGAKKLVICGDLFDRGEEAKKLQNFIVELLEKDEVILIRGNHEDLLEQLVKEYQRWWGDSILHTAHFSNGTVGTVLQLTDMQLYELTYAPQMMKARMENTPLFKKILPSMQNYLETEHYIFVHGWLPCRTLGNSVRPTGYLYREDWRNAEPLDWHYARWYNGMLAAKQGAFELGKTVVCGHWHTSYGHAVIAGKGSEFGEDADYSPYYGEGIIAIDACTAVSGKVNCIVLED